MSKVQYQGDEVLDIMSTYAPNRNNQIEKLIRENLGIDQLKASAKILEFGAGKGEFILRFLTDKNLDLYAVEKEEAYLNTLSQKIKGFRSINDVPADFDFIFLIDVLEHIKDDQLILNQIFSKLKIGGKMFIYVPARKELFSAFDKRIGHFRRYTLHELKSKVKDAGFEIYKARYHELLGYFASAVNKMFNRDGNLNPRSVRIYDKILVPLTNFMEKIIRIPIGKSVYVAGEKKN